MTAKSIPRTLLVSPDFWSGAMCAKVRAAMDRGGATAAEIYRDGFVVDARVRKSDDIDVAPDIVDDVERALEDIRGEVARFFGVSLTATEGPGFLRYPTGGLYRPHRDRLAHSRDEFPRRVSVVLFLTTAIMGQGGGGCAGGALRLYGVADPGDDTIQLDIVPVAGTLVAFPSDLLHEVLPVTAGVRDAIVDWFY